MTTTDELTLPIAPTSTADLEALIGVTLPSTDWFEITAERVEQFADATEDHQPIHMSDEAGAASAFGARVAHGYYTIALSARFLFELMNIVPPKTNTVMNVGIDKCSFTRPVPVGGKMRMEATLKEVTRVKGGDEVCDILVECKFYIPREGKSDGVCCRSTNSFRIVWRTADED